MTTRQTLKASLRVNKTIPRQHVQVEKGGIYWLRANTHSHTHISLPVINKSRSVSLLFLQTCTHIYSHGWEETAPVVSSHCERRRHGRKAEIVTVLSPLEVKLCRPLQSRVTQVNCSAYRARCHVSSLCIGVFKCVCVGLYWLSSLSSIRTSL